ncbi:MAG TPA: hypothetical protein DDZ89_08120 [Clostridiales bacterium]|nr:hypothetical protein [Clostridiales bacterium]
MFLKIAQPFVSRILDLPDESLITGDIISFAHRLGFKIIAEGVEHPAQKEYLEKHHCDMVQGFLFERLLSEDKAIQLLMNSTMQKSTTHRLES